MSLVDPLPWVTFEQQALVENVRRFVREEIDPVEATLPPDAYTLTEADRQRLVAKVAQMELQNFDLPKEAGGAGLDFVTVNLLAMEMSQHRAGLYAPCYGAFGGSTVSPSVAILCSATEQQRKRYLQPILDGTAKCFFAMTEPGGGSDPARSIRAKAERVDGGWSLTGTKVFITGASEADFGLVFARTGEGRRGISCFVVERDQTGFAVGRIMKTLRRADPATELEFADVQIPDDRLIGEVGGGFQIARDTLIRQRVVYAAITVGPAICAQKMAINYVKSRETFGAPLSARQAIQWMLVDNEVDIRQAQAAVLDAAARADRGQNVLVEASLAKVVATEALGRVIDRVIQIYGGAGVSEDLPFERWFREGRIRRIGEGPSEVQRMVVARELLSVGNG